MHVCVCAIHNLNFPLPLLKIFCKVKYRNRGTCKEKIERLKWKRITIEIHEMRMSMYRVISYNQSEISI